MSHSNNYSFSSLIITLIIIVIILFVVKGCRYSSDVNTWNDGYCSCGGKWVYDTAVGHRFETNYVYICDKCGNVYEFDEKMDVTYSEETDYD